MSGLMRVTRQLDGRHPLHSDYPLLPGDIVSFLGQEDGWMKHAPGLGISGFVLSDEDVETLEKADGARWDFA